MPAPQEIIAAADPPLALGSCILRRPDAAEIVQNALLHFEGQRYRLRAWCIMPNHVHVIVRPLPDHELSAILHSWKSFTSTKINRLLRRQGALWERESFDHLIRKPEQVDQFADYIEENPVVAGLCATPRDWPFSSCGAGRGAGVNCGTGFNCGAGFQLASDNCGAGFQPADLEFVDPREIPFVPARSRGELPHLHKPYGIYFVTWRLLDAVELKHMNYCGAGFQPASETTPEQARMPAPQNPRHLKHRLRPNG